jgi:hypothetical protein
MLWSTVDFHVIIIEIRVDISQEFTSLPYASISSTALVLTRLNDKQGREWTARFSLGLEDSAVQNKSYNF